MKKPASLILNGGLRLPFSSPAKAAKGLKVEPGGYTPRNGLLINGLSSESFSNFQFSTSMPSTNRLESNVGMLTNANTSPVLGFMATSAPRRSPKAVSAISCNLLSADNTKLLPDIGATLESTRTALPSASISTC